ncbi:galactose-binding like protein [Aspergillus steynii IBT 23096]|uniref:Galactose-binding like protein n=1 Tax=Aspergillus steynii IBT 23096 TaxID=1392250 RepID=A0A2I2G7L9_9EURO|nr:galactose-binding like protein [Aspergillus steynii IBT 23096]PLB48877.1 galactose-binding like protein [Aspergillus steynii IBT 23096]
MPRHPHHPPQQQHAHLRRHPAFESTSTPPAPDTIASHPTAPTRTLPPDPRLLNAAAAASNAQSRSRAQFQTPPSRAIPQLHPSSGPLEPSDTVHPAAAAQAAIFSLFGRGVPGRQRHGNYAPPQGQPQPPQPQPQGPMQGIGRRRQVLGYNEDEGEGFHEVSDEEDVGEEDEEEEEVDYELDDEEDARFADQSLQGARVRRRGFTDRSRITLDPEGNEIDMSDEDMEGVVDDELEEVEDEEEVVEEGDVDEDEMMQDRERSPSPLPANLREISSLASWTVSTHKPGCGVAALRNPSPTQYWQSDGPQPHTLTLHFFKLVAVVKIRVYLDCEMDESYTPTKMTFLAGMGGNDVVEFATWEGEGPCGWVDVPLEGVGGRDGGWVRKKRRRRVRKGEKQKKKTPYNAAAAASSSSTIRNDYVEDEDEGEGDETAEEEDDEDDPYAGNVLKAMVIQMRVIENHQNGKDTHVRGFQVFARDDERRRMGNAPSASADGRVRRHSARKSLRASTNEEGPEARGEAAGDLDRGKVVGLEAPDWMGEPVIR